MSLKFEPLTPRHNLQKWNEIPRVLDIVCSQLAVEDLCKFALLSRACTEAAYNESLWIERLQTLNLVDNVKVEAETQVEPNLLANDLSPLDALDNFEYTSGKAREGFMKLYRVLGPLYDDLVKSGRHVEPVVFRAYRDPVDQAKALGQLRRFAQADPLEADHEEKLSRLNTTCDLFENAALAEFEQGYDAHDMKKVAQYAKVLITLNGGDNCVQLFIQKHPLLYNKTSEDPNQFIKADGAMDFEKFEAYLKNIAELINKETADIDRIFPQSTPVTLPLLERVIEDNIMELISALIDKFHSARLPVARYLRIVPEIYVRLRWFRSQLTPNKNGGESFVIRVQQLLDDSFGLHVDQYLAEELQDFVDRSEQQVSKWNNEVSQQQQAQEKFYWSNVTKEQDKSDFLTSFKKVLMMPVNVMPFHSNASQSSVNSKIAPSSNSTLQADSSITSRPTTPVVGGFNSPGTPNLQHSKPSTPPSTELDAMVAIMNSKLEGISTMFSLELALQVIRDGRDSIDRISKLTKISGRTGKDAREQCEQIFVELVRIVGDGHVKSGFDKAIDTLNQYDPRQHRKMVTEVGESSEEERNAVEPLAIFAELVNIGDLIQQMIHVFFVEELAQRKYIDRNDFMAPSLKAKKRFEQTLDNSVADGLNRGIEVLVDQIDFIFMTMQLGSDFFPDAAGLSGTIDIGPTEAAKKVVSLLRSHVSLLAGSTEKSVIDVFQQEIGVRFYASIGKHLKRQVVSVDGAIKLISDINYYYNFIASLRQRQIMPYFEALKEICQLFLIDGTDAKALGSTLSDMSRFRGVMQPEEVFEFVQRRADWLQVRREVERVMYGFGVDCVIM